MPRIGQRVQLTAPMEALGSKAQAGDKGTVQEIHAGGHLTVRMDNGRVQFPRQNEITELD